MNKSLPNNIGILIFVLFAVAPFFGFFTINVIGREYHIIMTMLCYVAIFMIFYERFSLYIPIYIWMFGLFTLYTICSDVFIVNKKFGFFDLFGNKYLGSFLILLIIENTKVPEKYFRIIYKISIGILYIAFVVIVIQQFVNESFFVNTKYRSIIAGMSFEDVRLPSIYSWVGAIATIGLSFFPVLAVIVGELLQKEKKGVLQLLLIGALVAFFNKSRFIMLNFLIILILIPIYKGFTLHNIIKYSLIAFAISISVYFGAKTINYDIDKIINERILEKSRGGMMKGAAGTRILAFEVFSKLFPENPLFGKGMFHSFGKEGSHDVELVRAIHGRSSQIHVGYLSLFYYYGFAGGFIYLLFIVLLTVKLVRDAKITKMWGPLVGWSLFVISNLTTVILDLYLMGIIILLLANKYYLQQNEINETSNA